MRFPTLTLRQTLIWSVMMLAAMMAMRPYVADSDMPWHIVSGQVMLQTGDVIRGDLFSHTLPGVLRPHHEWGTQVMFGALYNLFGHVGPQMMSVFFTVTAVYLSFRLMRGNLSVRLFMALLAIVVTPTLVMARPQGWMLIFSLVLTSIVLYRKPSPRWIPLIMLVWINIHGGWMTGYLVLGAGIFGETVRLVLRRGGDAAWWRSLTLWTAVSVPLLWVNPYGFDQIWVFFDTFTQAARPFITEWNPLGLISINGSAYIALLYIGAVTLIGKYRSIGLTEALLLIGFAVWSLTTARITILYALIAPVILAPHVTAFAERVVPRLMLRDYALDRPLRVGGVVAVTMSALALLIGWVNLQPANLREVLRGGNYPVDAVDFLRAELESGQSPQRELFNDYNWGGYLIFHLPEYPVFIDTRADLYDGFFLTYFDALRDLSDWRALFAQCDIGTVLLFPTAPLAKALRADAAWRIVYEDERSVIFRPSDARSEANLIQTAPSRDRISAVQADGVITPCPN